MAVDTSAIAKLDVEPGTLPETMAAWVIRQEREGVLLLVELDRRPSPLKVEADGQLVLSLHDCVVHLGVVDLADDIKRV